MGHQPLSTKEETFSLSRFCSHPGSSTSEFCVSTGGSTGMISFQALPWARREVCEALTMCRLPRDSQLLMATTASIATSWWVKGFLPCWSWPSILHGETRLQGWFLQLCVWKVFAGHGRDEKCFSFRLESREKLIICMHMGFTWGAHGMKCWLCCQAQGRLGWLLGMEILLAEALPSGLWSNFQQRHLEVMLNRMWQERVSPSWSLGCSLEPHLRLLLSLHTALQSCCSEKGWQEPSAAQGDLESRDRKRTSS